MAESPARYRKPGPIMRRLANPLLVGGMRMGVSIRGSRVLEVRGRRTGTPRRTPVNLLELDRRQYLVSPRGESQWVRNVRADNGQVVLILGRRRDERIATELSDEDKAPILRAYLRRWKMEVGMFFQGVSAESSDEELRRVASAHPVFQLGEQQG